MEERSELGECLAAVVMMQLDISEVVELCSPAFKEMLEVVGLLAKRLEDLRAFEGKDSRLGAHFMIGGKHYGSLNTLATLIEGNLEKWERGLPSNPANPSLVENFLTRNRELIACARAFCNTKTTRGGGNG